MKPWSLEEDAALEAICWQARRQGLRGWDAAVTAADQLGRGVHACRVRIRSRKLMARPYRGRRRSELGNGRAADGAGVEPEAWGKPLSYFRGEGGGQ